MEKDKFDIDPIFKELVQEALDNNSAGFQFIGSLDNCRQVKHRRKASLKAVKLFKQLAYVTELTYRQQILDGNASLDVLLALVQFNHCTEYYQNEARLMKDMLKEYKAYVFGGHFIDTLVGNYRKEEDMVDYRKLPVKFF